MANPIYIVAAGPEGLSKVLSNFVEQAKQDKVFAEQDHYVLYQLGGQRSLIRVHLNSEPPQFWYFDKDRRPAMRSVQDAIAKVMVDGFQFDDVGRRNLHEEQHDFLHGGEWVVSSKADLSLEHAFDMLQKQVVPTPAPQQQEQAVAMRKEKEKTFGLFGMWRKAPTTKRPESPADDLTKKSGLK